MFRSAYLLKNDIPQEELEVFEAWACLRWILLHRNGGTPKGPNILEKVKRLIINNPILKELEIQDFPIKEKIWSEWLCEGRIAETSDVMVG